MKVIVLPSAKERLRSIIAYYRDLAGPRVAARLKHRLLARLRDLQRAPRAWPLEEYLEHEGKQHRKLLEGDYKIIYWIDQDMVIVTDFFDGRRDPKEMRG